jgi:hypothetical protein
MVLCVHLNISPLLCYSVSALPVVDLTGGIDLDVDLDLGDLDLGDDVGTSNGAEEDLLNLG